MVTTADVLWRYRVRSLWKSDVLTGRLYLSILVAAETLSALSIV